MDVRAQPVALLACEAFCERRRMMKNTVFGWACFVVASGLGCSDVKPENWSADNALMYGGMYVAEEQVFGS
jgi:hypothetical protein